MSANESFFADISAEGLINGASDTVEYLENPVAVPSGIRPEDLPKWCLLAGRWTWREEFPSPIVYAEKGGARVVLSPAPTATRVVVTDIEMGTVLTEFIAEDAVDFFLPDVGSYAIQMHAPPLFNPLQVTWTVAEPGHLPEDASTLLVRRDMKAVAWKQYEMALSDIKQARAAAFKAEVDPLVGQVLVGEKTVDDLKEIRTHIRQRLPYPAAPD